MHVRRAQQQRTRSVEVPSKFRRRSGPQVGKPASSRLLKHFCKSYALKYPDAPSLNPKRLELLREDGGRVPKDAVVGDDAVVPSTCVVAYTQKGEAIATAPIVILLGEVETHVGLAGAASPLATTPSYVKEVFLDDAFLRLRGEGKRRGDAADATRIARRGNDARITRRAESGRRGNDRAGSRRRGGGGDGSCRTSPRDRSTSRRFAPPTLAAGGSPDARMDLCPDRGRFYYPVGSSCLKYEHRADGTKDDGATRIRGWADVELIVRACLVEAGVACADRHVVGVVPVFFRGADVWRRLESASVVAASSSRRRRVVVASSSRSPRRRRVVAETSPRRRRVVAASSSRRRRVLAESSPRARRSGLTSSPRGVRARAATHPRRRGRR